MADVGVAAFPTSTMAARASVGPPPAVVEELLRMARSLLIASEDNFCFSLSSKVEPPVDDAAADVVEDTDLSSNDLWRISS